MERKGMCHSRPWGWSPTSSKLRFPKRDMVTATRARIADASQLLVDPGGKDHLYLHGAGSCSSEVQAHRLPSALWSASEAPARVRPLNTPPSVPISSLSNLWAKTFAPLQVKPHQLTRSSPESFWCAPWSPYCSWSPRPQGLAPQNLETGGKGGKKAENTARHSLASTGGDLGFAFRGETF